MPVVDEPPNVAVAEVEIGQFVAQVDGCRQVTGLGGTTLTKIGAGVLVFSNNNTGGGANNFTGSTIFATQGQIETRFALGGSNPLGTATVQLLGAQWNLRTEADGTSATQNIALGNNLFVGSSISQAAGTVTVQYAYTPAVPEPSSWALLLAGLGVTGRLA